jgi:flagellar biogenesis protein FliO
MNRMFAALIAFLIFTSATAMAGIKVASLDFVREGSNRHIFVALSGKTAELPELEVKGRDIFLTIKGADNFSSISKDVHGAKLSADFVNSAAVIQARLPYEVPANSVSLGWKQQNIEVIFPRGNAPVVVAEPVEKKPSILASAPTPAAGPVVSKDALNEEYLDKMMIEANANPEAGRKAETKSEIISEDLVNTLQSSTDSKIEISPEGKKSDSFSFAGYAAKFTGFLVLVLALFYGIVQVLKRGVFNRGKLGFLNNSQLIQVLSTTYVSPKRSLLVVKAHNQIFLVANSENGLQFLSEMKDSTGLIKEGEKMITGTNFDVSLAGQADIEDQQIKLKENILESTPVPEDNSRLLRTKDIVKFSEELKKKAKKLKPIEFN